MKLPPDPKFAAAHKFNMRRWSTRELFAVMAIYHGICRKRCPRSWRYRVLIKGLWLEYSERPLGKGYGPVWRGKIKYEVLHQLEQQMLSYAILKFSTEKFREAELQKWMTIKRLLISWMRRGTK